MEKKQLRDFAQKFIRTYTLLQDARYQDNFRKIKIDLIGFALVVPSHRVGAPGQYVIKDRAHGQPVLVDPEDLREIAFASKEFAEVCLKELSDVQNIPLDLLQFMEMDS